MLKFYAKSSGKLFKDLMTIFQNQLKLRKRRTFAECFKIWSNFGPEIYLRLS